MNKLKFPLRDNSKWSSVGYASSNENGHREVQIVYHQGLLKTLLKINSSRKVYVQLVDGGNWLEKDTFEPASFHIWSSLEAIKEWGETRDTDNYCMEV